VDGDDRVSARVSLGEELGDLGGKGCRGCARTGSRGRSSNIHRGARLRSITEVEIHKLLCMVWYICSKKMGI
jgi:hypothetical protein